MAEHDGVDGLWFAGPQDGCAMVEKASVGNLKQVWTTKGRQFDWSDKPVMEGDYFLQRATQVKNIWVPYGA